MFVVFPYWSSLFGRLGRLFGCYNLPKLLAHGTYGTLREKSWWQKPAWESKCAWKAGVFFDEDKLVHSCWCSVFLQPIFGLWVCFLLGGHWGVWHWHERHLSAKFENILRAIIWRLFSLLTPGTQRILVLNGNSLLFEGSNQKIEDKQVPGKLSKMKHQAAELHKNCRLYILYIYILYQYISYLYVNLETWTPTVIDHQGWFHECLTGISIFVLTSAKFSVKILE